MSERFFVLFLQAELPGQVGFVRWVITRLLDVGEEAFAELHGVVGGCDKRGFNVPQLWYWKEGRLLPTVAR